MLAVLLPRLGNSAWLLGTSFLLSLALALPVGVSAAARPQGRLDAAVNLFCFAGISVPPFWLALLLIGLFSVELGWFPAGGMETVGDGRSATARSISSCPCSPGTLLSVAAFTATCAPRCSRC